VLDVNLCPGWTDGNRVQRAKQDCAVVHAHRVAQSISRPSRACDPKFLQVMLGASDRPIAHSPRRSSAFFVCPSTVMGKSALSRNRRDTKVERTERKSRNALRINQAPMTAIFLRSSMRTAPTSATSKTRHSYSAATRTVNAAFKCRSASEVEMSHFFFLMEPLERSDRLAFELAQALPVEGRRVRLFNAAELIGLSR